MMDGEKEGWDLLLQVAQRRLEEIQKKLEDDRISLECYEVTKPVYDRHGKPHPTEYTGNLGGLRKDIPYLEEEETRWLGCIRLILEAKSEQPTLAVGQVETLSGSDERVSRWEKYRRESGG